MRVFVAGATGVLGRRLVRRLVARGHEVAGLVRDPAGARRVAACGGRPHAADLFDAEALARGADGCDVIVHAATAIPVKTRTTARDWRMNDRIRRDGTRALATCAAKVGARLLVQQSVVWVARPPDGSFFDELTEPRPEAVHRSALEGESIAREVADRHGFAVAVLRCGWFYGDDAAHTLFFREALRRRRLPVIGDGRARWSCLHLDDAAEAFAAAVSAGRDGLWHVVDDEPVPCGTFLRAFAARLGARPPRRVPVWIARAVAGAQAVAFFTRSTETSNARFRRDFGWRPRFPSYREGLDQIVERWSDRSAAGA